MTAFAHIDHPTQHPGVVRAERLAHNARELIHRVDSARANASLLLAAIVAALLVAANQVVDTWTDGHLLGAWMALWVVAFAALALLATPVKSVSSSIREGLAKWKVARRHAAADDRLWQVALTDARVMADISRAMSAGASRDLKSYF